ncbi:CDP-glycerol:glycerophosphate glycerophosphotransferase [Kushneria marisflavi]|uniref:Uncharacterized protein n=1 Tax=Kushneria marisflavi TaxID=157779 RepID=A0A240USC6_9GAMM|nr:CDP-glycerol glycerophosphotransferase family protein [Kushneria marisflavi]ART63942.1 hypothetical protein B9H00_13495 [Kushneria marisflavi]RKD85664.1 CDP-glycerol glycerophosphotransferase (TagB/SpsB family) [Kushneria marisflavi]
MLQKSYSNFIKNKRKRKRGEKLKNYFNSEQVYDEVCKGKKRIAPKGFSVSIIIAMYNSEEDIDVCLTSLVNQTIEFKQCIEVILVDDGSTDSTQKKCEKWVCEYPENIFYYKQSNQGVAGARNFGIDKATKEWLSFIDSDDFVNGKYFEEICALLNKHVENQPDIISCNVLVFKDGKDEISASHPLNYKYREGGMIVNIDHCSSHAVQLFANSCLVKNNVVKNNNIIFPDIKPSFEDGYFINHYMLVSNKLMILSPRSKYFYRKKENSQSLISTSWDKKERYNEQIKGYLSLCKLAMKLQGSVPDRIQKVVAYDLMWHFKHSVGNEKKISFLSDEDKYQYKLLLKEAFKYVNQENIRFIERFNFGLFYEYGIYNFAFSEIDASEINILDVDGQQNVKYRYFTNEKDFKIYPVVLGQKLVPVHEKIKQSNFLGEVFAFEHIAWVNVGDRDYISFEDSNKKVKPVKIGRNPNSKKMDGVFCNQIKRFYRKNKINDKAFEVSKKFYRKASSTFLSQKFDSCWLFMDRDTQADDNAEYFYEFVSKNKQENIWFVLRKNSFDWKRLKEKGFKLIEYGSISHKLALLKCEFLISSHADEYIINVMPQKFYKDILKYKFIFLQHGVIKHDMSSWLNNKNISLFVTSTADEFCSIAGDFNSYNFTKKEVALTGLPRHDCLYKKKKRDDKSRIVIMPTWRKGIVGKTIGLTNERHYNNDFINTEYFCEWNKFFKSEFLKKMAFQDIEVILFMHANIEPYVAEFDTSNVKVLRHGDVDSMQDLFVDSDLMITDYSSVAFEMAFLQKPVIYYQFDRLSVYSGESLYVEGYFNFENHGFGPVLTEQAQLEESVANYLENDFKIDDKYIGRMKKTFPYEKGKACERVYQEIVKRRSQ